MEQEQLQQEEKTKGKDEQVVVVFNITGFGRFHGVESNPTSELVKYLPAHLDELQTHRQQQTGACSPHALQGVNGSVGPH